MAAIASLSSSLIIITPCVALPASLILSTGVLSVIPDLQVIIKSSVPFTSNMPTSFPVFSVTFIVFTPFPPLLVMRYSSTGVFLPKPFSLITNTVDADSPLFTQIMPITSSVWSSTSMPPTPIAPRPVGRTVVSGKRIARPLLRAIIISQLPSVIFAASSSSPSIMVMAFTPVALGRLNSSSTVFLITPFLVQRTI